MQNYADIIFHSPLFQGIPHEQLELLLTTLSVGMRTCKKNEFLLHSGSKVPGLGILLSGSASILKEDFWGNRNIISRLETGDIFAESYACSPETLLSVSVLAEDDLKVLFLDIQTLLSASAFLPGTTQLLQNLLSVTAHKNLLLNEKLTHLSRRTTREKLLSYLSAESIRQSVSKTHKFSNTPATHPAVEFDIPFNRQQLADYLSVDRSAMSAELGRMRDEGLLSFHKNHFVLL